jgi:ABC-type nitrate/sulfonate/bicarbonate transport system permease component
LRQPLASLANASDFSLRLLSLALFVITWMAAAALANTPMLPGPWAVAKNMVWHAVEGELLFHVGVTLTRVLIAFVIAMAVGTAIGIVMGRQRKVDMAFDAWLVLGLNVPALVVIILCYIWFGLTDVAAVTAVAINKIPTVVVTVREGARAIDRQLVQVAQIYRLSPYKTLTKVYLPQLFPYIMAAARSGLALIWKIVLVVELLGRSEGVGFQLSIYFQFFDISSILAYTLAFIGVVLFIEMAMARPLEVHLTRWRL